MSTDFPFGANADDDPEDFGPNGYPADWDDKGEDIPDDDRFRDTFGMDPDEDDDFALEGGDGKDLSDLSFMRMEMEPLQGFDDIPGDLAIGVPAATRKRRKRWLSVRKVYEARFTQKVLEEIWQAFWEKSLNADTPDRFGIAWKPLAQRTIEEKSKLINDGVIDGKLARPLIGQVRDRRMFSPRQMTQFRDTVNKLKQSVSRSTAERRAFKEANLKPETVRRDSEGEGNPKWDTPMNVRYGELITQFFPGSVYLGRFYSGPGRFVGWEGEFGVDRHFVFEIHVTHARSADSLRSLLPDSNQVLPLMEEAHQYALPYAKERYLELKEILE